MASSSSAPPPVPRRCVVTGSAGFIGARLCEHLVAAGWSVLAVDGFADTYDPAEKVVRAAHLAALPGVRLTVGDLVGLDLPALLAGAEVVFHLAGRAGVRPSFQAEGRYRHDNVTATERVLAAARSTGVRRVVYASSSSVYGDGPTPSREDGPLAPISPYGRSKLEAEQRTLAAAASGLETVALRYFTVYGPGQRPDMALRLFAEAALAGRPITLLGDGSQRRDFTFVDDVVAATVAAADAPACGLAVNVGAGSSISLLEVIDLLGWLIGARPEVELRPFARGDARVTAADPARAHSLLGFRPRVPFEEGLARQLDWLRGRARPAQACPA